MGKRVRNIVRLTAEERNELLEFVKGTSINLVRGRYRRIFDARPCFENPPNPLWLQGFSKCGIAAKRLGRCCEIGLSRCPYSKGRFISLPKNAARFQTTKFEALKKKVLQAFGEDHKAEAFLAKIMERYPRYIRDQLAIIDKCQDQYQAPELGRALRYCQERELLGANDFRDTLEYFRQAEPLPVLKPVSLPMKYSVVRAQTRPVSAYIMTGGEAL